MQILISFVRSFSYHRILEFGLYQFFLFFFGSDTIDFNHSGTHCKAVNTGKGKAVNTGKVVPQLFVVALLFMIVCSSFRELCAYPMIIRFKALYHKHGINILILMVSSYCKIIFVTIFIKKNCQVTILLAT